MALVRGEQEEEAAIVLRTERRAAERNRVERHVELALQRPSVPNALISSLL